MAARYFWGKTKMDRVRVTQWVDLDAQSSAPVAAVGRFYVDASGKMKLSEDGTVFITVTTS